MSSNKDLSQVDNDALVPSRYGGLAGNGKEGREGTMEGRKKTLILLSRKQLYVVAVD